MLSVLKPPSGGHAAAFHCRTWRTIVDVGFHSIDQIELHDLEPAHRAADVKLHQKLALGVIDNHVVRRFLAHPHVDRGLNDRLAFTGASYG